MSANRITALLRTIADYRVEACFLAALVFTLGHNSFHHRAVEVRTTTRHERTIHEVVPVRVAAARRATHVIARPEIAGVVVPAPHAHGVGGRGEGRIVMKHDSHPVTPCPAPRTLARAGVVQGSTCKVIRVAPAAPEVALPRTLATGG